MENQPTNSTDKKPIPTAALVILASVGLGIIIVLGMIVFTAEPTEDVQPEETTVPVAEVETEGEEMIEETVEVDVSEETDAEEETAEVTLSAETTELEYDLDKVLPPIEPETEVQPEELQEETEDDEWTEEEVEKYLNGEYARVITAEPDVFPAVPNIQQFDCTNLSNFNPDCEVATKVTTWGSATYEDGVYTINGHEGMSHTSQRININADSGYGIMIGYVWYGVGYTFSGSPRLSGYLFDEEEKIHTYMNRDERLKYDTWQSGEWQVLYTIFALDQPTPQMQMMVDSVSRSKVTPLNMNAYATGVNMFVVDQESQAGVIIAAYEENLP